MAHAPDIETAVVGGGVIGLAIALSCAKKGQQTTIIERNSGIGEETSSRSSEVIHAGLYYPKGSLKAKFCVQGKRWLYKFCSENGVPYKRVGKLVVATSQVEIGVLKKIEELGLRNGVSDLRWLSGSEARSLEPELNCLQALFSPSSGIIDSHAFMRSLEGHLQSNGGSVVLKTGLRKVTCEPGGAFKLCVANSGHVAEVTARNLVVAGGLGMATLRQILPSRAGYEAPQTYFAKGHYFSLQRRSPFHHLVYPAPVDGGLGTHLTLDLNGRARFGPDVEWINDIDYAFNDPAGKRRAEFERSVQRFWPALPEGALQPGYTGIRPKLSRAGASADFEIHGPREHGIPRMVALYGIESPGLTSSLPIAEYCAALLGAQQSTA